MARGKSSVVKQFKSAETRNDLFAGTPDTLFIRWLVARASCDKNKAILMVDISVAFMHARTAEEIYARAPRDIQTTRFWMLKAVVNGARKASQQWQEASAARLHDMGFDRSDVNPCVYRNMGTGVELEQHGDDFLGCGDRDKMRRLAEEFKNHFLAKKAEIISMHQDDNKDGHFLKRKIHVDKAGWHIEMEPRYVESLLVKLGMDKCKPMAIPGSKEQSENYKINPENRSWKHGVEDQPQKQQQQETLLDQHEHREYRAAAGFIQYLCEQRMDVNFACKEVMREAARPTTSSMTRLNRIIR